MKNKILKKILLVVVCVSLIVASLVVPAFAYTNSGQSTLNSSVTVSDLIVPSAYLSVDYYQDGNKKTSYKSPLFTESNVSTDNRVAFQTPDAGDYGQLEMFADTSSTSIYDMSGSTYKKLLKQSVESYVSPNYSFSGTYSYYLRSLHCNSLYYYDGNPQGLNYSTFICLGDNYSVGDVVTYTRFYSYIQNDGTALGSMDSPFNSTVVIGEDNLKGVYIYYYDSNTVLKNDYLVTNISIYFDSPVIVNDNFSYNGETGFFKTVSRYILDTNDYYTTVSDFLSKLDYDGYQAGYSAGESAGYQNGYDVGESAGYQNGYDVGYNDGYVDGGDGLAESPFAIILSSVSAFLSWEFIPGVSFSLIASVFVGSLLMIILLKKLAGG